MKNPIVLTSPDGNSRIAIDNGELVSYIRYEEELMHHKDEPGWNHTEIEMFPLIGPVTLNDNKLHTSQGDAILDQHGMLRLMKYKPLQNTEQQAVFVKNYSANTPLKNEKYPEKSTREYLHWTYDFTFTKSFELSDEQLSIHFKIESKPGMPFMLGYHPTFRLSGDGTEEVVVKNTPITLEDIMKAGDNAYPVIGTEEILLKKKKGQNIRIFTKGFGNAMFWTPHKGMLCIEPVTHYPDLKKQVYSDKNMRVSKGTETFEVIIRSEK